MRDLFWKMLFREKQNQDRIPNTAPIKFVFIFIGKKKKTQILYIKLDDINSIRICSCVYCLQVINYSARYLFSTADWCDSIISQFVQYILLELITFYSYSVNRCNWI